MITRGSSTATLVLAISCGVLLAMVIYVAFSTIFDLSSLRDTPGASSAQRTGTLPYMALELLTNDENGNPPKHLYRHDVESIFYVILLLCCRYKLVTKQTSSECTIVEPTEVRSLFKDWYRLGRDTLKDRKLGFFTAIVIFSSKVNNSFADFQLWVDHLREQFMFGFSARNEHMARKRYGRTTGPFDEDTLQGWMSYSVVTEACSQFAGSALIKLRLFVRRKRRTPIDPPNWHRSFSQETYATDSQYLTGTSCRRKADSVVVNSVHQAYYIIALL
ncbi:hypothetical protein IW262DRAFT_318947 [Armillaria fumosa]|nr:hypothetical protein IW262DRAFT_318947 [Armillaria fumosa]